MWDRPASGFYNPIVFSCVLSERPFLDFSFLRFRVPSILELYLTSWVTSGTFLLPIWLSLLLEKKNTFRWNLGYVIHWGKDWLRLPKAQVCFVLFLKKKKPALSLITLFNKALKDQISKRLYILKYIENLEHFSFCWFNWLNFLRRLNPIRQWIISLRCLLISSKKSMKRSKQSYLYNQVTISHPNHHILDSSEILGHK